MMNRIAVLKAEFLYFYSEICFDKQNKLCKFMTLLGKLGHEATFNVFYESRTWLYHKSARCNFNGTYKKIK